MALTYEPITTQTLSATAITITINSIPATYSDLRLVLVGRGSSLDGVRCRFNGDTTASYSRTGMYATSASSTGASSLNQTSISTNGNLNDASANGPGLYILDIIDYRSSAFKTCALSLASDNNQSGTGQSGIVSLDVGSWANTATISSITLGLNFSNYSFQIGTTVSLYGILRA